MSQFLQPIRFAWLLGLILTLLLLVPTGVFSQEDQEVKITDNSFLVEEAYNQEPGVVQHIFNWVPAWEHGSDARRTFDFIFTQEWPIFSERHQISYTIPFTRYDDEVPGDSGAEGGGLCDILLNYRYQLLNDQKGDFVACTPRFSLIFPSGDPEKGLGNGKLGYQLNFPFSKTCKHWEFNFNAGLTEVPGVTGGINNQLPFIGRIRDSCNIAASAIYFLRPNFHLMLEQTNLWTDEVDYLGEQEAQFLSVISPGFRWAPYTKGDTQWVLGLGLPVGISNDAPDIGVFFYMSFEHRFMKKPDD